MISSALDAITVRMEPAVFDVQASEWVGKMLVDGPRERLCEFCESDIHEFVASGGGVAERVYPVNRGQWPSFIGAGGGIAVSRSLAF